MVLEFLAHDREAFRRFFGRDFSIIYSIQQYASMDADSRFRIVPIIFGSNIRRQ